MKRTRLNSLAALACLLALPALAQEYSNHSKEPPCPNWFGLQCPEDVAWRTCVHAYAAFRDQAEGGGLLVELPIGGRVKAVARAEAYNGPISLGSGNQVDVIPVEIGLRVPLLESSYISPYVEAGLGYYFLEGKEQEVGDEVGGHAAVGLQLSPYGRTGLFVEMSSQWVRPTVSATLGAARHEILDLSDLGLNAGIFYRW